MVLAPNQKPKRKQKMSNIAEDRKVLIEALRASGSGSTSLKRLRAAIGIEWSADQLCNTIEQLEKEGLLSRMGSSATHFSVDEDLLRSVNLEPSAAVAESEDEAEEADSGDTAASATPPSQPTPAPKTKLMSLMDKLAMVTPPKILEGDEREARLAELFEECVDRVVEIDEAIKEIGSKFPMYVDADKDRIYIVRVTVEPGSTAPGGLRMTYSPPDKHGNRKERVLFETPWPRNLTESGGEWIPKKVESIALGVVERMTDYITRHASKGAI